MPSNESKQMAAQVNPTLKLSSRLKKEHHRIPLSTFAIRAIVQAVIGKIEIATFSLSFEAFPRDAGLASLHSKSQRKTKKKIQNIKIAGSNWYLVFELTSY